MNQNREIAKYYDLEGEREICTRLAHNTLYIRKRLPKSEIEDTYTFVQIKNLLTLDNLMKI